jgi:hypothetical protein
MYSPKGVTQYARLVDRNARGCRFFRENFHSDSALQLAQASAYAADDTPAYESLTRAMMPVKISQTNWRNENCQHETHCHHHKLDSQHGAAQNYHSISHDGSSYSFVNKSRIRVQKGVNKQQNVNVKGWPSLDQAYYESEKHPKEQLPEIITLGQPAKCFLQDWMHLLLQRQHRRLPLA